MTVLWRRGPSTVGEMREQLASNDVDLAYNTVLSMLRILEEKGYVAHLVEGKAHRYHALVDRARAGQRAVTRMLDTVFGGSAELLLTHLVRDTRVDAQELRRLQQVLNEHAKRAAGDGLPAKGEEP